LVGRFGSSGHVFIEHEDCSDVLCVGPHGHGEGHDHDHHHHHEQHEDSESSQGHDWLSAVVQPAHTQKDVLVDTARTALDRLAEQVSGSCHVYLL